MLSSERTDIHHLYSNHHSWLRGWLGRKLGCSETAADIAQDTFIRLLVKRRSSLGQDNEPRALLTHIARCLVVDHWRRQEVERAYLETLAHLPEAETPSPETHWQILEVLYQIESMLRTLPPLTRDVFLLAQLDGMKYADIATYKGVSLPTVKRHMRNAFLACLQLEVQQ